MQTNAYVKFNANHTFNKSTFRHYLNDELTVLHCHHYITLFTQLADDAKLFQGEKLLAESMKETIYPILIKYYNDNNIESKEDKTTIAELYYAYVGLGQLKLSVNDDSGTAEMKYSHVDEGWIKKWSTFDKPINFVGCGFLAAAAAAITNNPINSFNVKETQSIVCGAEVSKFTITKN